MPTPDNVGPYADGLHPAVVTRSSSAANDGSSETKVSSAVETIGTNGLHRDITYRHMTLIALSGSIGAGLFVGSGQALSAGGPASLVICFAIIGFMVSLTMAALGEMATSYPVAGAFYDYSVRFIGRQWGFAMGWNFAFNWMIVLPFEITTIVAQLGHFADDIKPYYVIIPFLAFLSIISFKGARWFGELEHFLGLCKAVAITTFIMFALVLVTKGIPGDSRGAVGSRYWRDPGAFQHGFQGFLAVLRVAGMSYGGTELLGLTAAECRQPHRIMPFATKVVYFRLAVFYIGALLMLGFTIPSTSPELASSGHGAKVSPFVVAARLATVPRLGDFFAAMIIMALVSMANASIFAASRALQALCEKGMGPKVFARVTAGGVPLNALMLVGVFSLLSFVTCAPGGEVIFDWLLSISSMSNYFTWASICLSHIRMRRAMRVQGFSVSNLIWRSTFGEVGSYVGLVICLCSLCAQFVVAFWPIGGVYDAQTVVREIIGIPTLILLFVAFTAYLYFRHGSKQILVPLAELDLAYGLRDRNSAREADEEHARKKKAERQAKLEATGRKPRSYLIQQSLRRLFIRRSAAASS